MWCSQPTICNSSGEHVVNILRWFLKCQIVSSPYWSKSAVEISRIMFNIILMDLGGQPKNNGNYHQKGPSSWLSGSSIQFLPGKVETDFQRWAISYTRFSDASDDHLLTFFSFYFSKSTKVRLSTLVSVTLEERRGSLTLVSHHHLDHHHCHRHDNYILYIISWWPGAWSERGPPGDAEDRGHPGVAERASKIVRSLSSMCSLQTYNWLWWCWG